MASATNVQGSVEAANTAASRSASVISDESSSVLDRLSNWYSENKALAWTLAGIAVVGTGAVVYYSSSPGGPGPDSKPRKSKKDWRKEKAAQEATKPTETTGTYTVALAS